MPYFVECSKPIVAVAFWGVLYNHPINLALCGALRRETLYEDKWPSLNTIVFSGCDTKWCFETEKDRDAEIQRLIDLHLPDRAKCIVCGARHSTTTEAAA